MISEKKMTVASKFMLFLATLIWGSSFFILKNTLDEMPVYFILCIRFLSSALLLGLIFLKKWKHFNVKYLWAGGITGVFLGFAYIFQTFGLLHTTPGINAFLTEGYCVLVPFMCWAVFKKKPTMLNLVAAAICIVGIGLVCLDGGGMSFTFKGEGFTLICSVFFGLQMVTIEKWGKDLDPILFTIFQFIGAFVVCLIFFFCFEKVPTGVSIQAIISTAYVSVFATTIAYVFMTIGIKHTSANYSSLIFCLEAVFGVAFSIAFYHERVSLQVAIGFVVIFIGIVINEVKPSFLNKN